MRKLVAVMFALVAVGVVFWRVIRKDYWQTMRSYSKTVLADIERLKELIAEEWPLRLGPEDEATQIRFRWVGIRWDTDSKRLQVPAWFEDEHEQWWGPARQYMAEVNESILQKDKEQTSAKLTELKTRITGLQAALHLGE